MNKRNSFLLMSFLLGATAHINAMMMRSNLMIESNFKKPLQIRFTDPKTIQHKIIVLDKGESSTESLKFGELADKELFVANENIENWPKYIVKWYSANYEKAQRMNLMRIRINESGLIDCEFFAPNDTFLGGTILGHLTYK